MPASLGAGFVLIAAYLLHSLFRGRVAPANPWGGNSLEWHTPSPPPHDNFAETPTAADPYDFTKLQYDPATDSYAPKAAARA